MGKIFWPLFVINGKGFFKALSVPVLGTGNTFKRK